MKFSEVMAQTLIWLKREGRVSYRALKREFAIDDEYLEDIKAEVVKAKKLAQDEDGEVLVWVGKAQVPSAEFREQSSSQPPTPDTQSPAAERRQITVLFCDLVGSTALSAHLDPEDYRAVVQAYQAAATVVIVKHQGHLAQHWGDGLLVYFGYPTAHEDDARRAVRTGLEIIQAIQNIVLPSLKGADAFSPSPSQGEGGASKVRAGEGSRKEGLPTPPHPSLLPHGEKEVCRLQVRLGVHTGLVVIGEIGGGEKRELLALGETPNLAARIQSLAEPNTVLMSAATQRLVDQQFESQPFGSHLVKGFDAPIAVYHVQSERQNISLLAGKATLTPLVGREQEVGLLIDRWAQVKEGRGQILLLSGEPGIGKSRLALTLKEHVANEGSLFYEARCSPYHQQSALYPLIESLQRTLLFTRQDTDEEKVAKLERALVLYEMQESLPLFTAFFSLPIPSQYPPLHVTPQKQKERTLQALLQLLMAQAERQATVLVWEDLHWADPSSLEFLSLLIEQIPTTKLLLVLTFRPEFSPPWKPRSHISQLMLNRLGQKQVEAMIEEAAGGKILPPEVIEQIRIKTDGVPLFIEEVTKAVLEADEVGARGRAPLQLSIPATLQEALLARLDRLSEARQAAQLGATLGREFSYELLHAVSPLSESALHSSLAKLVEAEILYQRGTGEQSRYFFKHALIQDTAYQSLLKSTRQQYHQQIAQVLEERFPDVKELQPEMLAHHYTEANLIEQAISYWQQAGQKTAERSANQEAISHLRRGILLLKALPDSPDRTEQELALQLALGGPLIASKGLGSSEVEHVYARARILCQQMGETPQLFQALYGLRIFYHARAEFQVSLQLAEQLLSLARILQDSQLLLQAHRLIGESLLQLGQFGPACMHQEQVIARYDSHQHRFHVLRYGLDPKVACLSVMSFTLWMLGYPNQALQKGDEAINLAHDLIHPYSLAWAVVNAAGLHMVRRDELAVQKQTEAAMTLAIEQEFTEMLAYGNGSLERKPKRTSSCPKFTTGSPKALTRRICKKRRRCLMN